MEKKKKINYKLTLEEEQRQELQEYHESILQEVDKLNLLRLKKETLAFKVVELTWKLEQAEEQLKFNNELSRKNVLDLLYYTNNESPTSLNNGLVKTVAKLKGKKTGKAGGDARVKSDPKTLMMKEIEAKYHDRKHLFKLRGRTTEFINEMHTNYPTLAYGSIRNAVTKWKKVNK